MAVDPAAEKSPRSLEISRHRLAGSPGGRDVDVPRPAARVWHGFRRLAEDASSLLDAWALNSSTAATGRSITAATHRSTLGVNWNVMAHRMRPPARADV
jgi:hypothetical protein